MRADIQILDGRIETGSSIRLLASAEQWFYSLAGILLEMMETVGKLLLLLSYFDSSLTRMNNLMLWKVNAKLSKFIHKEKEETGFCHFAVHFNGNEYI